MTEIWIELVGYREIYEVSNLGNVRRKPRNGARGYVVPSHELIHHLNSSGYYRVDLNLTGERKSYFVHRLVAELFLPPVDGKTIINHKDGNKLNNRVDNLEWCTRSENEKHAFRSGLKKPSVHYGEDSHFHKLTNDEVRYIKKVHRPYDKDFGSIPLAERFNVDPQTITDIVHGRTWKEN